MDQSTSLLCETFHSSSISKKHLTLSFAFSKSILNINPIKFFGSIHQPISCRMTTLLIWHVSSLNYGYLRRANDMVSYYIQSNGHSLHNFFGANIK
jgi:hypothetical protein